MYGADGQVIGRARPARARGGFEWNECGDCLVRWVHPQATDRGRSALCAEGAEIDEPDRRGCRRTRLECDGRAHVAAAYRGLADLMAIGAGHEGHSGEALDRAGVLTVVGERQGTIRRPGGSFGCAQRDLERDRSAAMRPARGRAAPRHSSKSGGQRTRLGAGRDTTHIVVNNPTAPREVWFGWLAPRTTTGFEAPVIRTLRRTSCACSNAGTATCSEPGDRSDDQCSPRMHTGCICPMPIDGDTPISP